MLTGAAAERIGDRVDEAAGGTRRIDGLGGGLHADARDGFGVGSIAEAFAHPDQGGLPAVADAQSIDERLRDGEGRGGLGLHTVSSFRPESFDPHAARLAASHGRLGTADGEVGALPGVIVGPFGCGHVGVDASLLRGPPQALLLEAEALDLGPFRNRSYPHDAPDAMS